ncbi:MAG: transposase [Pedobacter sp.]|nr:MAG: transposase [Pedobacter sp.]
MADVEKSPPSFDTCVFLKIYLCGYLNGLRSSRKFERKCARDTELQWLLCGLVPNYHSISDLRKDNPTRLKKLFKVFVSLLKDADMIAGETIATDGTKSRAHKSKKANFSQKKIAKHLAYIEEETQGYLCASPIFVPSKNQSIGIVLTCRSISKDDTSKITESQKVYNYFTNSKKRVPYIGSLFCIYLLIYVAFLF